MGMFSSLFGSSGSDKADKMRQQAMDVFNSVKTPELSALQVKLNDYVNAGKISPEEAEAQMLNSNAFNAIKTDPSFMGAAKKALTGLQDVASQGGTTAIDKARMQDITDNQNQENRSSNEAIMRDAEARGTANSNLTSTNQLIQQQASADRAARSGTQVAADAQTRALQALQAAGTQGANLEGQQFQEGAAKAESQNAIDKFNAANKNDMTKFNTTNNLASQEANLTNAQNVANLNTQTHNAEKVNNANANQTVFQDELAKANGKNGVLSQWANDSTAQKRSETAADMALTGQIVGAGMTAATGGMGGPAAAGASTTMTPQFGKVLNPTSQQMGYSDGGMVLNDKQHWEKSTDPEHESDMLVEKPEPNHNGDAMKDLSHFTDPSKLHAKQIKPAAGSSLEDEYHKFVQSFCMGGTVNMADGGSVTVKPAKNMKGGGAVPGKAVVHGDSPKNDNVPANLSPGEVVLPRSVVSQPEKIMPFVKESVAPTSHELFARAIKKLTNPHMNEAK